MEAEWIRLIYVAYTRSEYMLMIPYYAPSKNEDVYIDTLRGRTKAFLDNKNNIFSSFIDEGLSSFEIKNKINSILNSISKEDELEKMNSQKRAIKELIKSGNDKKSFKHAYSSLSPPKDNKEALDIDDPDLINKEGEETFDISDYDKINIPLINNLDNNKLPLIIPNKFPKGADIGSALHEVFELSTFTDYSLNCYDKNIHKLELIIDNALKHYKINLNEYGINYIKDIVKNVLNADLTLINGNELLNKKIKLSEIDDSNKKAEMEFNFNLMNQKFKNYCNGFIDLVFRQGDYFSILDWKSDGLNEDDLFSYSDFDSLKNHTDNHYSIQRVLYSYCLIKWLNSIYKEKDLEETFNKHFGGVYYVYLRGCNIDSGNGIYCQTWKSFNDLKKAFDFIIKDRIGGDFND
jgi:exodeoxyribonuclease V beta subunit